MSCHYRACVAPSDEETLRHVRHRPDDRQPPPRKPKDKASRDRRRKKHKERSRRGYDPRSVRAALQGMLLGFDRLAAVLEGEALLKARGAFLVGGDYPGTARRILGWPEPVECVVDPSIKPPWED